MAGKSVIIVGTGVANLASVRAALDRSGIASRVSARPDAVAGAAYVVLPGVGSFGAAMEHLRTHRLVEPLRKRIERGRPTLAICLGMQLLAAASEESPGVTGLGVLDTTVRRFSNGRRIPQFGWNQVTVDRRAKMLSPGFAYFANSYRLAECDPAWVPAWTDYGGPFLAAIERGAVLACQFHPELSGPWGQKLLAAWLQKGATGC